MCASALQPRDAAVGIPPRQRPYEQALQRGLETLQSLAPDPSRLQALGAQVDDRGIRIPVLGTSCLVDLRNRTVSGPGEAALQVGWAVLVVHYLAATDLAADAREVSFSYFGDCHTYLSVFGKRIVQRFLATTGRTAAQFAERSTRLGAVPQSGGGQRYRFPLLPRLPIVIVRYEGDEELAPGANVLYRADAQNLLPAEDRVVAAELLLDALAGKPMTQNGGSAC